MRKIMQVLGIVMLVLFLASCEGNSDKEDFTVTLHTGNASDVDFILTDFTELPVPQKENAQFVGWFHDESFTIEVLDDANFKDGITIYAKFENDATVVDYQVSFDMSGAKSIRPMTIGSNDVLNLNDDYTKENYIFDGFYYDSLFENPYINNQAITEDITLYAKWTVGPNAIKIGVVLPDASEERWANMDGAYFFEELQALGEGYEYTILFSDGDEGKEVQNVEALIDMGVQVIILTTEGSGAGAVDAAHAAGIPIIAHDRMAKSSNDHADYYVTFNSWNVGKAMGQHLVDSAEAEGCTSAAPCDLALFSGRVADWPNATYFFGGAMEALQPELDMFNIINQDPAPFEALALYTEATFDNAASEALHAAMYPIDTDWNPDMAAFRAESLVLQLTKTSDSVFVLAPNDDTSAAIRQEFAKMSSPYTTYYTTGQDASNVTLASLMGDVVTGKGTQTMTVYKDISKLVHNSVWIAKNIVDGNVGLDALDGLTSGASIDGAYTAYAPIDILLASNPQLTYDLIFATGYRDENDYNFSNIDFSPYK